MGAIEGKGPKNQANEALIYNADLNELAELYRSIMKTDNWMEKIYEI